MYKMDKCQLFIICCVVFVYIMVPAASKCPIRYAGSDVLMPHPNTIMSLKDFDTYVANKRLAEFYFATPNPAPFKPFVNFHTTFVKDGSCARPYVETFYGETRGLPGSSPACVTQDDVVLIPNVHGNRASFFNSTSNIYIAMWSKNPSSYVLWFQCTNMVKPRRRCPVENTYFAIHIHGTPDDLPMVQIAADMCRATGVQFGSDEFRWFFVYGDAEICAAQGIP